MDLDIVVFLLPALVAIIAASYLFGLGQLDYIKKNWVELRCNPIYMPMAGMVGDDVVSNFTKCTLKGFSDYAGFVMDPLMAEFDVVNDTLSEVTTAVGSMQSMMGGVRGGFVGIIGGVFGKINNLMSQFQYTIIRMRTLLARVLGVMVSFLNVFYTGGQTAESVMNGPIMKTMSFLCFDEDTLITLPNLDTKAISKISIGDTLYKGSVVTSIYKISGQNVPMYSLSGIKVSGSHKVKLRNKFVKVSHHPMARAADPSKTLYCLNTSDHRIRIKQYEFLDFIESTNERFVNFKRSFVEESYNGSVKLENKSSYGTTGVSPNTLIPIQRRVVKPIFAVNPGDILDNGEKVLGVVVHKVYNRLTSSYDNISMSPQTWILEDNKITPASKLNTISIDDPGPKLLFQLIMESSSFPIISPKMTRVTILDELELIENSFNNMKDKIITSGSFRGKIIEV